MSKLFELYDLRVTVEAIEGRSVCSMAVGDYFELTHSNRLCIPEGKHFCVYALSAVLPLLAAKQRPSHPNDWMTSDADVACPDPNCASRLRITRLGRRRFSHAATTAVPLPNDAGGSATGG